ncbi:hypothetical protein DFH09DRAFT_1156056 [Mycena vulgaris]|nr:hypothetical protein DFH09DRAFT_1156056 [Mycena vulgaris]
MVVNDAIRGEMDRLSDVIYGSATMVMFARWITRLSEFGLPSVVVQLFYGWRLWTLTTHKFIRAMASFIAVLALIRGLSAMTNTLELLGFQSHCIYRFSDGIQEMIWSTGGLLPDALIMPSMAYLANLNLGTTMTMSQIGAFPLICLWIERKLVVYWPSTNYHFVPVYILGKMYTNSLVSVLSLSNKRLGSAF